MKKFKLSNLYLIAVFIILYIPIAYMMIYSFNEGGTMNEFTGFTLEHYGAVLQDTRLQIIVLNTLIVALLSALGATVIGVAGAIGIYNLKTRKMQGTMLAFNNVMIVSPDVILGASFLILFTMIGIELGFMSVLMSHIAFGVPIVVLMVLPKLQEMSPALIDAAEDLGATRWQVLTKVILPYIAPGIYAGFAMALTYSLDDFAVTFFVTGNGFTTLSVEIYSVARQGVSLSINALSTIIFFITLAIVLGYYFLEQKRLKKMGVRN